MNAPERIYVAVENVGTDDEFLSVIGEDLSGVTESGKEVAEYRLERMCAVIITKEIALP